MRPPRKFPPPQLSRRSLDAVIETLTPIYKHDETEACPSIDDVATALPANCNVAPYNTASLYCTCNSTAASPDEVTISWPGAVRPCACDSPRR